MITMVLATPTLGYGYENGPVSLTSEINMAPRFSVALPSHEHALDTVIEL